MKASLITLMLIASFALAFFAAVPVQATGQTLYWFEDGLDPVSMNTCSDFLSNGALPWAFTGCWTATSGSGGGDGPPGATDTAVFDNPTHFPVNITIPATAKDIRFDATNGSLELTFLISSTLTFGSAGGFSDGGVAFTGSPNEFTGSPGEIHYTGTLESDVPAWDMTDIILVYEGTNAFGTMADVSVSGTDASGGPTIYCSPDCSDGGGNTNIIFGPVPFLFGTAIPLTILFLSVFVLSIWVALFYLEMDGSDYILYLILATVATLIAAAMIGFLLAVGP